MQWHQFAWTGAHKNATAKAWHQAPVQAMFAMTRLRNYAILCYPFLLPFSIAPLLAKQSWQIGHLLPHCNAETRKKKHEYFVTPPATPSSYLSNVMRTAPTGVQRFKRSSILLSSIITYACMLPRQIHGPWVPSEDLDLRRAPDRARGCGPPRQAATRR